MCPESIREAEQVMSHTLTGMSRMKHPAQHLGHSITGVNDTRKMDHADIAGFCPLLNGKVLNLDMTCSRCGSGFVDDILAKVTNNKY